MKNIFKSLFSKKTKGFTKNDHWRYWGFFELLDDLKIIETTLEDLYGEEDFDQKIEGDIHAKLIGAIEAIEFENRNDLYELDELFNSDSKLIEVLKGKNAEEVISIRRRIDFWKNNH
jgi:hypothetical protein